MSKNKKQESKKKPTAKLHYIAEVICEGKRYCAQVLKRSTYTIGILQLVNKYELSAAELSTLSELTQVYPEATRFDFEVYAETLNLSEAQASAIKASLGQ